MSQRRALSRTATIADVRNETTEAVFQESTRHFLAGLAAAGRLVAYHTYDSRRSVGGFPDWVVLTPATGYAIELKSATGVATDAQLDWLVRFGALGFVAQVVRPNDWPAIAARIERECGAR